MLGLVGQIAALVAVVLLLFFISRRLQLVIQYLGQLWLGSPERGRKLFYFLVAPGVVIHELAHALMAICLQVRVDDIVLFRPSEDGQMGAVWHEQTDVVRGLLIGTAPVWAAGALFAGIMHLFGLRLPQFAATPQPVEVVLSSVTSLLFLFQQAGPLQGLALFYVFFALGNSVLLSPQDLTDLKPFGLLVAVLTVLGIVLSQAVELSRFGWVDALARQASLGLNLALFLLLSVILADLLVVVPLYLLYHVLYRRAYPR